MKLTRLRQAKLNRQEQRLVSVMQVLGDNTRFKMFKILNSDKEMCVTEIAEALDISASAVSQHFRIFELVGLVDKSRDGQKVCYILRKNDRLVRELASLSN